MIEISQFYGAVGALLVSLIAFTIVLLVLVGLVVIFVCKRYHTNKIGSGLETATNVRQTIDKVKDKKKVAAISAAIFAHANRMKVTAAVAAAINVSIGRRMSTVSVPPTQCSDMNKMWRITGIAECMESRLGSRSW
ncbi:MAG: hypothetical protein FWE49_00045 [Synergistaceae bacterium]|nr:hypothetical protein [Synergistaceae bacterium]